MKVIGDAQKQETGRRLNHQGSNSDTPPGSALFENHEKGAVSTT